MFVPSEDDSQTMADLCLLCHEIVGVSGPNDPEITAIGESLGDPDDED